MFVSGIALPRLPGLRLELELPDHRGEVHAYLLEILQPGKGESVAVRLTQLDRDGHIYDLIQKENGYQYCGCQGWQYSRRQPKGCKHLTTLIELGLFTALPVLQELPT